MKPYTGHRPNILNQELENLTLPSLDREDSKVLEQPISLEGISGAISSFKPGKSPGLDGFPADWYQLHKGKLTPSLQKVFIAAEKEGILSDYAGGFNCK